MFNFVMEKQFFVLANEWGLQFSIENGYSKKCYGPVKNRSVNRCWFCLSSVICPISLTNFTRPMLLLYYVTLGDKIWYRRTDFDPKERLDITKYAAHSKKVAYRISLVLPTLMFLIGKYSGCNILEKGNFQIGIRKFI